MIDHGITGLILNRWEDAVRAVERVAKLSRRVCRNTFEHRFSAARMAQDYLEVYQRVIATRRVAAHRSAGSAG